MTATKKLEDAFGVVDFAPYRDYVDGNKQRKSLFDTFATNVMDALPNSGTILIRNAPVLDVKADVEKATKAFFGNDLETKKRYVFDQSFQNRGYIPYGDKKPQDIKEFFHIDRPLYKAYTGIPFDQIENLIDAETMQRHLTIDSVAPGFIAATSNFTREATSMGDAIMFAVGQYFGLKHEQMQSQTSGNSVARLIRYPGYNPANYPQVKDPTRATAHVDISEGTLLMPVKKRGLQIITPASVYKILGTAFTSKKDLESLPNDMWIDVPTEDEPGYKGCCIWNAGYPGCIKSNGIIPGTVHRVILVPGEEQDERFSFPFFYHSNHKSILTPFESAIDLRDGVNYFPNKGPRPITTEEYVFDDDRLPIEQQKRPWIDPSPDQPMLPFNKKLQPA